MTARTVSRTAASTRKTLSTSSAGIDWTTVGNNVTVPSPDLRPAVLCCVRAAGPVRAGQRGGGRPDETPGGDPQAGGVLLTVGCGILRLRA